MKPIDIFPWNDNFETGIPAIDSQHRQLVALLNRLATQVATGADADVLETVLDELADYAVHHFKTEEAIWHAFLSNDPVEHAHRAEHQSFTDEIGRLRTALGDALSDEVAEAMLEFLARWLASHILESDRQMAFVVRAIQQGCTGQAAHAQAREDMGGTTRVLIDIILSIYATLSNNTLRLMRELLAHRKADEALVRQSEYRALILRLAMSFINLPFERLDVAIHAALGEMASFFDADRAYIFRYDFVAQIGTNTHEWCAAGIEPTIDSLQAMPLSQSPDWVAPHRRGEPFVIADVAALPPGPVRDILVSQQIRSLITTPLMDGAACLGFVGFDAVRGCCNYGRDERHVLALFANLLVSIYQRKAVADELRAKSDALLTSHRRLLNILDGSNAVVYVADMQTHELLFVNAFGRGLIGDAVGKTCWQVIQAGMPGPCDFCTNPRLLAADGTPAPPVIWEYFNPKLERWYQLHDQAIPWDDGRYVRMEIALDITERKQVEYALRDSEERYRLLFEQSCDALMIVAPPDWRFVAGNPAMCELFGASTVEVLLTLGPADLSPEFQPDGRPSAELARDMLETALREGSCIGEWVHRRFDGREIPCTVLLTRTEISGQLVVQGTVRDISLQKAQQQQLERIAHYDPLTGLPNRVLLADRLHQAMALALRRESKLAIAYLDLDGFKAINDRHGHDVGDRLLVVVADRMRHALRDGDTLARLGGDEFVAVLIDLPESEACVPLLTRLLDAASEEVIDRGFVLQVSASLGVTFYPQAEPMDADQLLRQADQAMYQAKLSGKNRFHLFDMAHDRAVRRHHENLTRIRQALDADEFVLHYQPKVNMRSGEVVGLEALIRWQHPELGLLPPADFLPVIEGHSFSVSLGNWVIETALAQMTTWRRRGLNLPVSVNVGAHQLQQAGFAKQLGESLAACPDLPSQQLEIEVLETSALQDLELVTQIIGDCVASGVTFALDDFGTGYSSLTYLKRLPVGTLKIDRSFVRDMLDDPEDLAILEGVLGLARAFQRLPIAEGVETIAQGERLLDLGCELAQGYCIARPMPAGDVPHWVAAWKPPSSWHRRAPILP